REAVPKGSSSNRRGKPRVRRFVEGGISETEFTMAQITLNVNGKSRSVDSDPTTPLLYVLRDDLELKGPRFGCGLSQCGACTVIIDGNTVRSCSYPVSSAKNKQITTLEGLGTVARPHVVQAAFIQEQAAQCGYCMTRRSMNAKARLRKYTQTS